MKFYFPLCLLLAPLWASATIQITGNADIAPQLYLDSYTVVQSGGYVISGNCSGGPWNESMAYSLSETYAGGTNLDFSGTSQSGYTGPVDYYGPVCGSDCGAGIPVKGYGPPWTQSTIEDGTGLVLNGMLAGDTITGTATFGASSSNFTNTDVGLQWGWENANYNASAPLQGGSESISRTVVTILKLQTGGGAGSKLQNVFGMNMSVQQVAPTIVGLCASSDPASICGSTGPTNGPVSIQTNSWRFLPDNTSVVVAPPISGLSDYTFNLTATKYNSYLELFTEPVNSSDFSFGHGFWRLSTDAPTNAFPFVPVAWLQFLGQCEGFYPDNNNDYSGYPGKLQNDTYQLNYINLQRKFYISFPNLIAALGATYQVQTSPPNYDLVGWNCVNQACDIAFIAGMDESILNPQTPSALTDYLQFDYPGPWLNNSEIYYPLP